jgi:hypothetical protein
MAPSIFGTWLVTSPGTIPVGVRVYVEASGNRTTGMQRLNELLADHFVGLSVVMQAGGFKKAATIIKESLPVDKRTRSGDLAELRATEYVDSETTFRVPIRKLRWKSDREMPMHGNDVIAIDVMQKPVKLMKGESKSRAALSAATVKEATDGLDRHGGRPNPSTLAFITKRLYEAGRDTEANVFRDLQGNGKLKSNVVHLVFTLCGNDPAAVLAAVPSPQQPGITRNCAAVRIEAHQAFITSVFT